MRLPRSLQGRLLVLVLGTGARRVGGHRGC